eukprot:1783079-Rhodomonas_salina.3
MALSEASRDLILLEETLSYLAESLQELTNWLRKIPEMRTRMPSGVILPQSSVPALEFSTDLTCFSSSSLDPGPQTLDPRS